VGQSWEYNGGIESNGRRATSEHFPFILEERQEEETTGRREEGSKQGRKGGK
jgi:hypothetical protein